MPALVELHVILGRSFMFFAATMGLWGLFHYFTNQPLGPSYWGALVIGEGVAILQAIMGISQLATGGQPMRIIHFLYGGLTVLIWPALFGYMRGQRESRNETLTFGLGSLFLFGLALRAFTTG